jgi:hypothetical protein
MMSSGEVLREYSTLNGQVSWAVLKKDRRHVVVACDGKYFDGICEVLWAEHVRSLEWWANEDLDGGDAGRSGRTSVCQ